MTRSVRGTVVAGGLVLAALLGSRGGAVARAAEPTPIYLDPYYSAEERAAEVVGLAEHAGAFALHPLLPAGAFSPGLFQGTAGIGYELLRLARPDLVPSVLLWD